MPIALSCSCGKQLRVPDEYAGRRVKCSACGLVHTVAAPKVAAPKAAAAPAARASASDAGAALVRFACSCGKAMQSRAEYAGRSVRCPNCEARLLVPGGDDTAERRIRAEKPAVRPARKAAVADDDYDDDDDMPDVEVVRKKKSAKGRKRALWPWLVGGAVLLLLLLGGGVATVAFLRRGGEVNDLALVPSNAEGFITIRVADLWKIPENQKLFEQSPEASNGLKKMEKEIGLTPADMERITFVSTNIKAQEAWGVLKTLKPVDRKKIVASFPAGTKENSQGKHSYHLLPSSEGDVAVSILSDRVLVLGPEKGVKRCLMQMDVGKVAGNLDSVLQLANGKHHLVFGIAPPVAEMQKLKATLPPTADSMKPLLDMQSAALVLDENGNNVALELKLNYLDDGKSKSAKQAVDGLLAMGKMFMPMVKGQLAQGPNADAGQKVFTQMEKALNSVKVEQKGTAVALSLQLDTTGLQDSLMKLGMEGMNAQRPGGPVVRPPLPGNPAGRRRPGFRGPPGVTRPNFAPPRR